MTKMDALDEVIEILVKKAMEDETNRQNKKNKSYETARSEHDGVFTSSGYRKQA